MSTPDDSAASSTRCTTRTASRRRAGSSWRSPVPPRTTGCPRLPRGCSAWATPRSRSSPIRTPSSAATGCRPAWWAARHCSPARCRPSPSGGPAARRWARAGGRARRPPPRRHLGPGAGVPGCPAGGRLGARRRRPGRLRRLTPEWSDGLGELLDQLGVSVVAELELSAARSAIGKSLARLDIALEASSVGIWEVDLRRGVIDWDERCAAIFGVEGSVTIPMDRLFAEHVHPDDQESALAVMQAAIEARAQYTVELRTVRPATAGPVDGLPGSRPGRPGRRTRADHRDGPGRHRRPRDGAVTPGGRAAGRRDLGGRCPGGERGPDGAAR